MTQKPPKGARIEGRAELVAAITSLAEELRMSFVDISGFGEADWIEVAIGTDGDPRRIGGPLDIVNLNGRLRQAGNVTLSDFYCSAARATDNGIEVVGGRLLKAEARFCEVRLTPVEEAGSKTAPLPHGENEPAPSGAEEQPQPEHTHERDLDARWRAAVTESESILAERGADRLDFDERGETRPSRGDRVDHRQFGRCSVSKIDDDHVTLRKPGGRNVQLGLSILSFTPKGEADGRPLYEVHVRKKR
jgi:predicted DNA-binding protein with PD1-like motif